MPLVERFRRGPAHGMDPAAGLVVSRGTRADYESLAPFHYRAARPATVALVLVLGRGVRPGPAAVLVVSHPTLNASWRRAAWPGRYDGPDRRAAAARLNAEVRAISRVIVHPAWRGLGLATRLVRAYLARPLTARTEAAAVMGAACPFFCAAGMTEHRYPASLRDERLRAALARAGWTADDVACWGFGAGRTPRGREVERALRVWADASRATRGRKGMPGRELAVMAAGALAAPRVAYCHEKRRTGKAKHTVQSTEHKSEGARGDTS